VTRPPEPGRTEWEATIDHVANLARLHLPPAERAAMAGQLGRILEYVDQMKVLDTAGVPPTMTAVPLANAFREDEPRPCLSHEEALSNAPDVVGPVFRVPRVID
jgi:aspartyl-tRNA(Asn)/glutamyl-tRNA(Gln) amidotransferase subunit C